MVYPDWKITLAKKCIKEKKSPKNRDVYNTITVLTDTCDDQNAKIEFCKALHIYEYQPFVKEVLESCMLCDDYNIRDTVMVTGVPEETITIYNHFFFDTSVFMYRLQKFDYVRTYKNDEFSDANLYKNWALSTGINFFKWKFKAGNYEVVPKEVLLDLVGDTFFRAKEHINEPITSSVTRESLKWLRQATDSINSLQKMDVGNDGNIIDQFRVALEYKDETKAHEDIPEAEIIL